MPSHRDPYHYPGASPTHDGSGSESPTIQPLRGPVQSWSPTATISGQGAYPQVQHASDLVRDSLEVQDAEVCSCHNSDNLANCFSLVFDPQDMGYYPYNFTDTSTLPSTSIPDVGTSTMHHAYNATHDNVPLNPFGYPDYYPDYPYPGFIYEHPQHQHNTTYDPTYDPTQPLVHDTGVHPTQDAYTPPTSSSHLSSTQVFSLSPGPPVYQPDTSLHPTPDRSTPDGANNEWIINTSAGQYSHPIPVATLATNQVSVPGPSRLSPSSPEKKRLLRPNPNTDDYATPRRVVPRRERSSTVHSASPASQRRGSNPEVNGRGPVIPQDRYTTSTISSYNSSDRHSVITFNLDNPDQTGIPITDILNKTDDLARIRDGAEAYDMGKQTFTLRLLWPGYKLWSKTIAAMNWKKTRGPITRVKLAEAVATAIQDLLQKYRDKPYDPDYTEWNVGADGIKLNQICLVALHHVSRGSWQPELCLLEPRR